MGEICSWQKHWDRAVKHPSLELKSSGWAPRAKGIAAPVDTGTILLLDRKATSKTTQIVPVAPTDTPRAVVLTPADRAAHDDFMI